jgi:hypothetical protein
MLTHFVTEIHAREGVFVVKKTVVKRFTLKAETVKTLRGIELMEVAGGISTDACPLSMDPRDPCQCTRGLSGCDSPEQHA